MGKKGPKRHLKRLPAPKFWPIHRKEFKWTIRPSPGPHPMNRCLPLLLIVRDILGYAKTAREARRILAEGKIKVDGRIRRDYKFPVGLMDVIEIPDVNEAYRILPFPRKGLGLHPISGEEIELKLCRIENKRTVNGGHIQLNLHDGRNILIRVNDPTKPEEDTYKTMDVLQIGLPGQEIREHIKFEEKVLALVTWGKNMGQIGRIKEITRGIGRRMSVVTLESPDGELFQTSLEYVFPVGRDKPLISLPQL